MDKSGRQVRGDVVEGRGQLAADALEGGDGHDRDQGRNETVFDRRGARFVLGKTREKALHDGAPMCIVTLFRIRLSALRRQNSFELSRRILQRS